MSESVEEMRPIPGFPAHEISSSGVIRRTVASRHSQAGRIMTPWMESNGYLRATLCHQGNATKVWVHRMVCWAFHGDPPTLKHQAAHDNGVKTDNTPKNLFWKTQLENSADAIRLGELAVGERHSQAKLTDQQVYEIKFGPRQYGDGPKIASRLGICRQTVYDIRSGKRRSDVCDEDRP